MRKPLKNTAKTVLFLLLALIVLTPLAGKRDARKDAQKYVRENIAAVLRWIV